MLVLHSDVDHLERITRLLKGSRVMGVEYRQTRHGGLAVLPAGNLHEVDLDVILRLSRGIVELTWERNDLVEGLALSGVDSSASLADAISIAASDSDAWRALIGNKIINVAFGWQISEEGCPESMWSLRLTFEQGRSVVFALGEQGASGSPTYHPDSIVVIFDEGTARSYAPHGAIGNAWGS